MNIERIVAHLIARNTFAPDLKRELLGSPQSKRTKKVLSLIAAEWTERNGLKNLYDYALFEIPQPDVYCFFNIRDGLRRERFDVYLNDYNGNGKDCTFGFVGCSQHGFISCDAESAEEAIRRYCNFD